MKKMSDLIQLEWEEEEEGRKEGKGLKLEYWRCSFNNDVNIKGINTIVDDWGRMEIISTGDEVK